MSQLIRPATEQDAAQICHIYNDYVLNTNISFEEEAVPVDEMQKRIQEVQRNLPWLVMVEHGRLVGYAYATKWRVRHAYRHSAESTIYLEKGLSGGGRGTALYVCLLDRLKELGIHCVIGGIAQPNPASVALHEKLGFKKVAHFEQVGWKQGRWVDVAYWQRIF